MTTLSHTQEGISGRHYFGCRGNYRQIYVPAVYPNGGFLVIYHWVGGVGGLHVFAIRKSLS